ncbi:MAG: phosphotransferase [Alistipes sp.]|jgi:serine/threonine protein kinase|nr:phosphotransferase [Alistipes sp.]
MLRTTITDYVGVFDNPVGVFRSLGEPVVERDVYGLPRMWVGNSAAVFVYADGAGCRRFLKCYVRPNPHLRSVYGYVEGRRPALLPRVRLLRDELFVHTAGGEAGWVDVVEGEWTAGPTLDVAVARAGRAGDVGRLGALADAFDVMWRELSAAEWAHGDLKPENIVVREDGTLGLIDCDAMWIPELAGCRAAELGTPGWRDPRRTAEWFDKGIDDHPARIISTGLRDLVGQPGLYGRFVVPEI